MDDWHFYEWTTSIGLLVSFLVAIGTIALAILAFVPIRRTAKEYRNRQLNEIIEWAKTAREWDFTDKDNERLKKSTEPWMVSWTIISNHIERLMNILRTGHIMDKISAYFKKPSLSESIQSLMTEIIKTQMHLVSLREQIDFTAIQTPPNFVAYLDELKKQQSEMRQAAENAISEAAELL